MHNSRASCPAVVHSRRMCAKIARVKSVRARCVVLAAMSTVVGLLMSGASFAGAASPRPLNGVARAARSYDSCDAEQSDTSNPNGTYDVSVRGFPTRTVALSAPDGWACEVVDGNGSGASVQIFSPSAKADSYGGRKGVDVTVSANVGDGIGATICPYSTYTRRNLVYPCDAANSKRSAEVSVTYFVGNSASRAVVVMVDTPANVAPPGYPPGPGHVPTVTVHAVVGGQFDAWMTCRIGSTLSSTCRHDARAFVAAVKASPPFL